MQAWGCIQENTAGSNVHFPGGSVHLVIQFVGISVKMPCRIQFPCRLSVAACAAYEVCAAMTMCESCVAVVVNFKAASQAGVKRLHVKGRIRITFDPLVDHLPVIGAVKVMPNSP